MFGVKQRCQSILLKMIICAEKENVLVSESLCEDIDFAITYGSNLNVDRLTGEIKVSQNICHHVFPFGK